MRLLGVDHSIDRTGAARASIVLDLVLLLASLYISYIQNGGGLFVTQIAELTVVKP
ncbi:MAG: hypothetical protein ACI9SX_000169 [Pseudoalteromonas tetraodonis]|jgi:hypothetical protein